MPRKGKQDGYSRIKGRRRNTYDDDEFSSSSLALHEMPSGEAEEILCPYFDGSKLILPPGFEEYKKKVEQEDDELDSYKGIFSDEPRAVADDGTPLRRSSRTGRKRKQRYIYSDDESSENEESKTPKVVPSSAPIPTCMFVNSGVSGGAGIDANKEIFNSLPKPKMLASALAEDERIEFTIEVNESSDNDSASDSDNSDEKEKKRVPVLPDDEDSDSDVVTSKFDQTESTEPDIKVKDDPVFLSDDEVISGNPFNNDKKAVIESDSEGPPEQEKKDKCEGENDSQQDTHESNDQQNDLKPARCESADDNSAPDKSGSDSIERNSQNDAKNNGSVDSASEKEHDKSNFADDQGKLTDEPSMSNDLKPSESSDVKCSEMKSEAQETIANGSDEHSQNTVVSENLASNEGNRTDSVNEKLQDNKTNEKLQFSKTLNSLETDDVRSEEADSEKTEDFEPEAEHPLITEIKEKMNDYCSRKVEFGKTLELSGSLAITADNEKTISGSVSQSVSMDDRKTVENPVPTVCVPQELSNLVQQICKDKLQYSVELLIQGELNATIDGTLVSTICNFSFEPEEDDF